MPKIVIAADSSYKVPLERCLASVRALGCDFTVYNLGGSDESPNRIEADRHFIIIPGDHRPGPFPPCRWKPRIILDAMGRDGDVLYIDADMEIQKVPDLNFKEFDLAVTMRSERTDDLRAGWLYSGVIAAAAPTAGRFLRKWIEKADEIESDQHALNLFLDPLIDESKRGQVIWFGGTRILLLSAHLYNVKAPNLKAFIVHHGHHTGEKWRE